MGQQQRARTHAGRRQGRFGAGVAATNDNDFKLLGIVHAGCDSGFALGVSILCANGARQKRDDKKGLARRGSVLEHVPGKRRVAAYFRLAASFVAV
jgi:hypothetical protein